MRLALCLVVLLFPGLAYAGPAIAAIATYFAVSTATVILVAQITLTIALSVYGAAKQRKVARKVAAAARQAFLDSLQDRTVTSVAADSPHTYIYGRARVGSRIVAMFQAGANDEYKYLVCVHAAHECDGFEEIYINGKAIGSLDGSGNVVGGPYGSIITHHSKSFPPETHTGPSFSLLHTPNPETLKVWHVQQSSNGYTQTNIYHPYTLVGAAVTLTDGYTGVVKVNYTYQDLLPRVNVQMHLGTPGQTADASLRAALPDKWPTTATLQGYTYSVVRLDLNQPEFQNGIPTIEPLIRGKKLYDPRSSTTYWNQNNALAIMDYLMSPVCGVTLDELPIASYITAANVCDESKPWGNRYTINGAVNADEQQDGVLESMAQSMAGSIVSTTWEITAGKYVAPVAVLGQEDIIGSLAINPGAADSDVSNGIRGQYISPENLYVVTDFEPYQNATYVAADGRESFSDINFPWTDSKQRVHNLARIELEDQRNGYILRGEFNHKAWPRKINDRITFNSVLFGQSGKIYRVTDKKVTPGGVIGLTIKEDAPSIWDDADTVNVDDTPNTNLPDPFVVDPITNLQLGSGNDALLKLSDGSIVSRIHATWNLATSSSVVQGGIIEIEWFDINTLVPNKMTVNGDEVSAFFSPVEDGQDYQVRIRAVSPYFNVKSEWVYSAIHNVIGKTEPPPGIPELFIDGTVLSWEEVTASDLAGYVFKFHYGNNTDWNSATLLYNGLITESPFDLQTLPYGVVTIMGKAIDTSRNESQTSANIFTDLGDPLVENVLAEYNFDPAYSGTVSGGTVSGGNVVANSLDSFYGTDSQSFYDSDSLSFYEPSAFAQVIYTSSEVLIDTVLIGSRLVLELGTEGEDVVIEYRLVGADPFYGADLDSFYGADGDPFYDSAPGPWLVWPGSITATVEVYQFRVTIGAGPIQGKILDMGLVVDALDLMETIADLVIGSTPTVIPYLTTFTNIKTVQATLQANVSGAITVEINKTVPLSPTILAYNNSHTPVNGASADITIQGY